MGKAKTESIPEPPTSPASEAAGVKDSARQPAHETELLAHLLRIADVFRREGSLRQATDIYFALVEQHEGTAEAREARKCLMDIAIARERAREWRQARSLYERLL